MSAHPLEVSSAIGKAKIKELHGALLALSSLGYSVKISADLYKAGLSRLLDLLRKEGQLVLVGKGDPEIQKALVRAQIELSNEQISFATIDALRERITQLTEAVGAQADMDIVKGSGGKPWRDWERAHKRHQARKRKALDQIQRGMR